MEKEQTKKVIMRLTDEQKVILDSSGNVKIHAVAGSGKTSTLLEYARHRGKNKRILYIAFNKSVKLEALRRFECEGLSNIRVETAHSLAWSRIVPQFQYKVRASYKPWEISEMLKIKPLGKDPLTSVLIARHIGRFASLFCSQPQEKVQDLDYTDWVRDEKALGFVKKNYNRIIDGTRKFLALMNSGKIEIPHEFYLKKYQLCKPRLAYDIILFDEGQDASPVMLDVFLQQDHAVKLIVGDVHQQIYSWRYAVNALSGVDFKEYSLTASFRFPQTIADLAMAVLQWKTYLKNPLDVNIRGLGKKARTVSSRATIARTNLALLREAINFTCVGNSNRKIYFEGNLSTYTYASEGASIWDVFNLYTEKRDLIRDPMISKVRSFEELREYAELAEDAELLAMTIMVDEHGKMLPFYLKRLKENHLEDSCKDRAEMIFSTVHKCKGLEYDSVTLEDDFVTEKKLIRLTEKNELSAPEKDQLNEEINLLYVAISRSRGRITVPNSIFGEHSPYCQSVKSGNRRQSEENARKQEIQKEKLLNAGQYWRQQDDDRLRFLTTKGSPVKKIAEEMGRSRGAIFSRMRKLGIG
ncbi:MAG: ATP-dependent helicase [Fibrobacter sp.]|nr:ATP-dependent helicase [Fibrobacter sp.]